MIQKIVLLLFLSVFTDILEQTASINQSPNLIEGLDVPAYFVEVISEMTFDDVLKTRIFAPLGMEAPWFCLLRKPGPLGCWTA
ncbi:hypothetical protein ACFQZJ_01970 [Maribacter chungangensis]|uniref:Uncharacterized protein n=1 Tax=Maribacter chungangensis TaxID=1069117 RepID=A0ABW3AZD4_9FLAO